MSEAKELGAGDCVDDSLWIGSWNVHNWSDGKAQPNIDRIIKSLQETPIDVIGFQEALKEPYPNIDCLSKLEKNLKNKQLSTEKNVRFYQGVVLASKYDIIESFQVTNRLQLNVIQYNKDILLAVIVVHFDYRDEKKRINEYNKILTVIKKYDKLLPMVFIGDFNALTKSDYNQNEWKRITKGREENQWELPQTELLEIIKSNNYFYDTLYLFQNAVKPKKNKGNDDKKVEEKENKNEDDDKLNGAKWNAVLGNENLGTCRFDTRIDYVLVNAKMLNLFDIMEYQHLAHNDASDHKLVRVKFRLKK